ncbi:MAG TPA: SBBP repeat-containing protein [Candidatus Binataceae bacterium]|nr:SBBP repeat-containing protein [Candidatus Binataceae bacterium]
MKIPRRLGIAALLLGLAGVIGAAQLGGAEPQKSAPAAVPSSAAQPAAQSQVRVMDLYGRLPMRFERNDGQTDARVKFLARGPGYTLFLAADEAVLALRKPSKDSPARSSLALREEAGRSAIPRAPYTRGNDKPTDRASAEIETEVLRLKLVGANRNARIEGVDRFATGSNYFIGNDPKKWHTDVPNYARVRYRNIYPGIDLVYYGASPGHLEYDLVLAPGIDSRAIALRFEGAKPLTLNRDGDVVAKLDDGGEVIQHLPAVYREHDGKREKIAGKAVLRGKDTIGFDIASGACAGKEHDCAVYIDPALAYSTYLGGSSADYGNGIAVDSSGNAYITGQAESADFPLLNAYQSTLKGKSDAFVAKLDPSASGTASLLYSSYLGGSGGSYGGDEGYDIAVDSAGNAYVAGQTESDNFPTLNGYQENCPSASGPFGCWAAFVAKLDPSAPGASSLVYSTYLGGGGADSAAAIAVDSSGNVYVTGYAESANFPTLDAYQKTLNGSANAFVAELNPSVSGAASLLYSTYLGGSYQDYGFGIAVDSSGKAYVTGQAGSGDFPTLHAFQKTLKGTQNAFVAKIDPTKSKAASLLYSTYLGGSGSDYGDGIAVDSSGNAYVTGSAGSTNFPTLNAYQSKTGGKTDAFVAKLDPSLSGGASLLYSTYLGGSTQDYGDGIAVDSSGNAYVTGSTQSANFPTLNAYQSTLKGSRNAFVAELNPSASGAASLLYSTYLGGSGSDYGYGIAVDSSGNAYVTGVTGSADFPTLNAYQNTLKGDQNAFIAKLSPASPTPTLTATATPTPTATGPATPTPTPTPVDEKLTINPKTVSFNKVTENTISNPVAVTIKNAGSGKKALPVIIEQISAPPPFAETDDCGTLAPGQSCKVQVTCAPSGKSRYSAKLTIGDNVLGKPQIVNLSCTGAAPKK